ncbi:MAG: YceI family protein [Flavobacteriales bacterium]|jgi:polyisoprenoid-binding protein YceI|nr:YceI family protein [Flavobacteriales bacterium]
MKKLFITALLLLGFHQTWAQKYFTRTGHTDFKASVEAFEPVEAENKSTTAIIDSEKGTMAALVFVNAFKFEIALMQEHFNENYMDSDKFPKASFKGSFESLKVESLTATPQKHQLMGTLTIRGISKKIETTPMISLKNGKIMVKGFFKVKPQDFDIEIPSAVRNKIAKELIISYHYELEKR